MSDPIYDSGALIAAESSHRSIWKLHKAALQRGLYPVVPATVAAQVLRGPGTNPNLRRLLKGCRVVPLAGEDAEEVGALLAAARTDDIVDADVVVRALRTGATVLSSDRADLEHLAAALNATIAIVDV